MNKIYYLYRHIRLDRNLPFYIGIGTVYSKRSNTLKGKYIRAFQKSKSRNVFWKNITNKTDYRVDIVYETNDLQQIKTKEKYFIKLYGLEKNGGLLCNMVDGGYGIEGFKHSEETKRKIAEHSKNRVRKKGYKLNLSAEGRDNISKFMKTRYVSDETRQKLSNNLKGNIRGKGHKVKQTNIEKLIERSQKIIYQYDLNFNLTSIYKGYKSIMEMGFKEKRVRRSIKSHFHEPYKDFYWSFSLISSKDSSVSIST